MPRGIEAYFYQNCTSTNRIAESRYRDGLSGPCWIVAGQQSAGRGRKGRIWTSEAGNVYTSLLFVPSIKPVDLGGLPFICALAVRDTFIELGAQPKSIECKWPNDVLIHGKKASGILIESSASGQGYLDYVIIGIGMNLLSSPPDAQFTATSLKQEFGISVTVETAMQSLAKNVKIRIEGWDVDNFAPIQKEWTSCAWGLGKIRHIHTAQHDFSAKLIALDAQGGLKVLLPSGEEKTIVAADIFPISNRSATEL